MQKKNKINNKKNKGITLIALVVTIVILLILAGISISYVLGEKGIIGYAKKAKSDTEKATVEETLKQALTNWQMAKLTGEDISFKDYFQDAEKSGIENFEVIDENPSEDVQFIARVDGRILVMKADNTYVLTKSDNLVKNGFGTNGIENFSGFTNDGESFSVTLDENRDLTLSDYIEVDTSKKYYQALIGKCNNKNAINYIGLQEADCDKKIILNYMHMYVANSLTYLEKDLNDGDTEIYFHDLSGFLTNNIRQDNLGLIFWNYKDSTGYEYPELTYSRNSWGNLFEINNVDKQNNKIILKTPWMHGTIKKGTKVSQGDDGNTFNYGIVDNKMSTEYSLRENVIDGIENEGRGNYQKFCYGTKYIRILFLVNHQSSPNTTVNVKDVIFAEYE